jgi:hypothetical protein
LAAPATLPHIIGFLGVGTLLFLSVEGHAASVASTYIGMAVAYVTVAVLAERPGVRALVVPSEGGAVRRLVAPLLPPLLFGAVVALGVGGMTSALFGEQGPELLPLGLAGLFIAWSIGQALSFRSAVVRWPSPEDAPSTQARPGRLEHLRRVGGAGVLLIGVFLLQAGFAGTSVLDPEVTVGDVVRVHAMLVVLLSGVLLAGEALAQRSRTACQHDRALSASHRRWQVLAIAFAGWHLATAARHIKGNGSQIAGTVEEVVLMTLTVFLAIWSMTSRSRGSELGLVRSSNALFWGLGFGYAYAGSVAMLSTVMKDVGGVLSFGHVVVAASLLALLRSTGVRLSEAHANAMKVAAQGELVAARLAARHEQASDENVAQEDEPTHPAPHDAEAPEPHNNPSEASSPLHLEDEPIELLD